MEKKLFAALTAIGMLFCIYAVWADNSICPYDDDYKYVLKKALIDYLKDPKNSKLSLNEVKDMVKFYLINPSIMDADCSQGNINALVERVDSQVPDSVVEVLKTRNLDKCYACPDGAVCGEQNAKGQTCTCKDVNNDGKNEFCYLKPIIPPIQTCEICPDGTLCGEENYKKQTCKCKDTNQDGKYEYCFLKPLAPPQPTTTTTIPQNNCQNNVGCYDELGMCWYCKNGICTQYSGATYPTLNCSDFGNDFVSFSITPRCCYRSSDNVTGANKCKDGTPFDQCSTKHPGYRCLYNSILWPDEKCKTTTTTTIPVTTTTTIPQNCLKKYDDGDCTKTPCCTGLVCLKDNVGPLNKCCLPHECLSDNMCYENGKTWATLTCMDGQWVSSTCDYPSEKQFVCPDGTKVAWCHCKDNNKWECINSPENQCKCTKEGEYTSTPTDTNCCQGLTALACTEPDSSGKCITVPCNGRRCSKCGDGLCQDNGENKCNCLKDCPDAQCHKHVLPAGLQDTSYIVKTLETGCSMTDSKGIKRLETYVEIEDNKLCKEKTWLWLDKQTTAGKCYKILVTEGDTAMPGIKAVLGEETICPQDCTPGPTTTTTKPITTTTIPPSTACKSHIECVYKYGLCAMCTSNGVCMVPEGGNCNSNSDCSAKLGSGWECRQNYYNFGGKKCCYPPGCADAESDTRGVRGNCAANADCDSGWTCHHIGGDNGGNTKQCCFPPNPG